MHACLKINRLRMEKTRKNKIKPHLLGAAYHIGKCCKT